MKTLSEEYKQWSKQAQKAQIDMNMNNRMLAEELGYSRQFVTAVVNGRKETMPAIVRISRLLNIEKPGAITTK